MKQSSAAPVVGALLLLFLGELWFTDSGAGLGPLVAAEAMAGIDLDVMSFLPSSYFEPENKALSYKIVELESRLWGAAKHEGSYELCLRPPTLSSAVPPSWSAVREKSRIYEMDQRPAPWFFVQN